MRILILGAGGVGGYFGSRLIESGADITFLVRPARAEVIRSLGLRIESPHGNFAVQPKLVTQSELSPDYDLVALSPKAYDLDDALQAIGPALGDSACLLPLLNGVAHMERLDQRFGRDRVMGGVAHIAATLSPEGVVRQLNPLHILTVGARAQAHAPLAQSFYSACQRAAFDSVYSDTIDQSLWDKWSFLATLAGSTTLFRSGVGAVTASTMGAQLMRRMYSECLAVAQASGQAVSAAAQEKALEILMAPGSAFTASMLRDLLGGNRTEHEHILGEMARRAEQFHLDAPLIAAAYIHMVAETSSRPN